jgi:hypothetical protein
MAFAEDHGTRIFDQIIASGGLAHIGENIFDHLDVETFTNCHLVCKSWQHYIVNITNGQLWKRKYLQKLAKPGSDAHRLIKSNPKLFQFDLQADQGKFQIFADRMISLILSLAVLGRPWATLTWATLGNLWATLDVLGLLRSYLGWLVHPWAGLSMIGLA